MNIKLTPFVKVDVPVEKFAEWWNVFNTWDWPKDFPITKPNDWDSLVNYSLGIQDRNRYKIIIGYIKNIEDNIGTKECLRYHHLHNLKMKNWQFELWWLFQSINKVTLKIFPDWYFDVYSLMSWRVE